MMLSIILLLLKKKPFMEMKGLQNSKTDYPLRAYTININCCS